MSDDKDKWAKEEAVRRCYNSPIHLRFSGKTMLGNTEYSEPCEYCRPFVQALLSAKRDGAEEQKKLDKELAGEHDCQTWAECCDCRSFIAQAIEKGK